METRKNMVFHFEGKEIWALTDRKAPMFDMEGICKILEIDDCLYVNNILKEKDGDTVIEYYDRSEYRPFSIITKEAVMRLIEISPMRDSKKKSLREWFCNEVLSTIDRSWIETLEPCYKVFSGCLGFKNWDLNREYFRTESERNLTNQPKN